MGKDEAVSVPVNDLKIILGFLIKMDQAAQINRKIIKRIRQLIEEDE